MGATAGDPHDLPWPNSDDTGSRRSAVPVVVFFAAMVVVIAPVAHAGASHDAGPPTASLSGGAADVVQVGPSANLSVSPTPAHPGDVVTLDATASTTGNATLARCEFDVDGDGTYDVRTESCVHETTYDETGEYAVSVRVTTSADETDTASATVLVRENARPTPVANAEPAEPRSGDRLTLSAGESFDRDGAVVAYNWTVDGRQRTGETVSHTLDSAGDLTVTLRVTDDDGATAATTRTIRVTENRPPTAAVVVQPVTATTGEPIRFDARASADEDGTVVAYRWDVDGDGTVDRETAAPTLEITADESGERQVTVTVVDDAGATDAASASYAVRARTTVGGATTVTGTTPTSAGVATTATGTTPTAAPTTAAPPVNASTDRNVLDWLDPGFVPYLPDWLGLVLVIATLGTVLVVRRRESVRRRIQEYRERIQTGQFRRKIARSVSGFITKTIAKKLLGRGADFVEFVTRVVGDAVERLGRAIKNGGQRVADALRRIGG